MNLLKLTESWRKVLRQTRDKELLAEAMVHQQTSDRRLEELNFIIQVRSFPQVRLAALPSHWDSVCAAENDAGAAAGAVSGGPGAELPPAARGAPVGAAGEAPERSASAVGEQPAGPQRHVHQPGVGHTGPHHAATTTMFYC